VSLLPAPNFAHLLSLSGPHGTYEHARYANARIEHGYCTDDVARVVLVLARQIDPVLSDQLRMLLESSLCFLEQAQDASGTFVNRRASDGTWQFAPSNEDCWGRAMWALGTLAARSEDEHLRQRASIAFGRGAHVVSPWPRAVCLSVMGASELVATDPNHVGAQLVLANAAHVLNRPNVSPQWCWPEERLTYANAALPEALLAAGVFFGREADVERALEQLGWLLDSETRGDHLSVTPSGGRGPHEEFLQFDQQPIEVAALSDACVRALSISDDPRWRHGRELCEQWFMGANDLGAVMFDVQTGGGYDGLTAIGPNLNQGAESTIALLTTQQNAHRVSRVTQ
jgi:hypothetical protein